MEAKELLNQANAALDAMVKSIPEDKWETNVPTTPKWNVAELVNHIAQTNRAVTSILQDETPASEADNLDDPNPLEHWTQSMEDLDGTLLVFSDYDKSVTGPGGATLPAAQYLTLMIGDRLAHTWDLAGAIDADRSLPVPLVEAAYSLWEQIAPGIKRGEDLGEIVDVPEDASVQDKFLALTGRDPK